MSNPTDTSRPPIIGLAGGIGAGKSAVAKILADLGCLVVDSDRLGRAALDDPAVKATLTEWWGDRILDASGVVDRSVVASIVFEDGSERRRLEGLVHPWIEAKRRAMFAAASPGTPALVIDAPLLFEAGIDGECDAVIFVEADRATRLARVRSTRGWDEAELARREAAQIPLDDKRARSEYTVVNTGSHADLAGVVSGILDRIRHAGASPLQPNQDFPDHNPPQSVD